MNSKPSLSFRSCTSSLVTGLFFCKGCSFWLPVTQGEGQYHASLPSRPGVGINHPHHHMIGCSMAAHFQSMGLLWEEPSFCAPCSGLPLTPASAPAAQGEAGRGRLTSRSGTIRRNHAAATAGQKSGAVHHGAVWLKFLLEREIIT